jgi:hypothetical protein
MRLPYLFQITGLGFFHSFNLNHKLFNIITVYDLKIRSKRGVGVGVGVGTPSFVVFA